MYAVWTHILYLAASIAVTVWVARTLYRSGRVFLVDAFGGNEALADSVNHLLVVGFYLINVGYVTLALKYGEKPIDGVGAIEFFSTKIGFVLLVLGAMHFFNLFVFSRIRKRGLLPKRAGQDERRALHSHDRVPVASATIDHAPSDGRALEAFAGADARPGMG